MKQFLFTLFLFLGIWVAYAGGNGNVIKSQEQINVSVSPKTETSPNAPVAYMISVGLASVAIIALAILAIGVPSVFALDLLLIFGVGVVLGGIFYLVGNHQKRKFFPERYDAKIMKRWKTAAAVLNGMIWFPILLFLLIASAFESDFGKQQTEAEQLLNIGKAIQKDIEKNKVKKEESSSPTEE